jgi:hypothetical protein
MQSKTLILLLVIFSFALALDAQITVTNVTFPEAGDSLKTATDLAPENIIMTGPGGPQTWDFTSLDPDLRQVTVFQPSSAGTGAGNFPGAELVVIDGGAVETYYDVSASAFSILGIGGAGIAAGFPVQADLIYSPPLTERKAPLNFFDINAHSSNANIALPTSAIPDFIFDSLGIPTGLFDSIRIRININYIASVDGYGSLSIPGGTYEVLRQKQTTYTSTNVDIHTFLGWVDISTILGGGAIFPSDTTITFGFFNDVVKEPIAVVTTDSTGLNAVQIEYKDNGVTSAVNPITGKTVHVSISPNPALDEVRIQSENTLPGRHFFHLYNLSGKLAMIQEIQSEQDMISINGLNEGLYTYLLINEKGETISSGKLVKAKR